MLLWALVMTLCLCRDSSEIIDPIPCCVVLVAFGPCARSAITEAYRGILVDDCAPRGWWLTCMQSDSKPNGA